KAKISARINHNSRIEATYNTNSIEVFYEALEQSNTELRSISELSEQVFTPGIFKRIRTNNPEKGVPFLSGSDLLNQYPNFQSFLSRKMKNIDNYILHDGWLAIQDAGTIGYLSYITKFLDGVSATNNLVRVVPNADDNKNYYIYCFLKTKVGQRLLKSLEYGSVQKHIDNHQVSNFKIPMFKDIEEEITRKVKKCMDNLGNACFLEKEAIDLVE
ncbi:MAG: restriction endonuclease subunit S, partial [Bacteroidetes bacterium]|nr:restriction endonuclease subunit S [Bacteroidota bacterium]